MGRLILTRVGVGLLLLAAASILIFLGVAALPGDAAQAALGQQATPALLHQLRHDFGLDRPLLTQYWDWLSGFAHGDLGRSLPSGQPVSDVVGDKLRNSAVLAGLTLLVLIPLSVVLGVLSATWRGGPLDHVTAGTTLALISTPEFVVGTLLAVVLGVWLGWFQPVSLIDSSRPVLDQLSAFMLPLLALLAATSAQTIRMVRTGVMEELDSEYVQFARLKGASERRVLVSHVLPNSVGPTIQILAFNAAWLVGGIVVIENVFQFPGLGSTLTFAVQSRDLPTVQAIAMLIALVYVVLFLLADVAGILANPRLRRGSVR